MTKLYEIVNGQRMYWCYICGCWHPKGSDYHVNDKKEEEMKQ